MSDELTLREGARLRQLQLEASERAEALAAFSRFEAEEARLRNQLLDLQGHPDLTADEQEYCERGLKQLDALSGYLVRKQADGTWVRHWPAREPEPEEDPADIKAAIEDRLDEEPYDPSRRFKFDWQP